MMGEVLSAFPRRQTSDDELRAYLANIRPEVPQQRRGVIDAIMQATGDMFGRGGILNPTGPVVKPTREGVMGASQFAADMLTPGPGIDEGLRQIGEARESFREGDYLDAFGRGVSGVMQAGADIPQLAIFAGPTARTANRAMLRRAQDLAEEGADRRAIWDETGWFRGPDGQWRFEIDDSASRLTQDADMFALDFPVDGRFRDVLDHPALADAYGMGNRTKVRRDGEMSGSFDPRSREIAAYAPNVDDARSVLLHEGQHAVQVREGFQPGGNVATSASDPDLRPLVRAEGEVRRAARAQRVPDYDFYLREILDEADSPAARQRYEDYVKELTGEIRPEEWNSIGRDIYRRLAGEVEARNVQTRMNMAPDQRRATPPWETQDVPDDLQIVRRGR